MANFEEARKVQREGLATIMAIATANPQDCFDQSTFPDFYFRITNSEDKLDLKEKFRHACEKSDVRKRYFNLSEEFLKKNPITVGGPWSMEARYDMVEVELPKLAKEAATESIKEWGRPISEISHLVFCSNSGVNMPGADYQLAKLLELRPSVKRLMLYHSGCYAGGTVLRIAKDIAENNRGARVLVVSCEMFLSYFQPPSDTNIGSLMAHTLFGDGAAALIVGANPVPGVEKPLFEIASAVQSIVPDSDGTFYVRLREVGFMLYHLKDIADLVSKNIENFLTEAFEPLGISDWNSIFWISHPGARGLLDKIEEKLGLKPDKLQASRHILSEYGNLGSASVLFTLNEIRKKSLKDGLKTTGEGLDWGVLLAYGAGLTAEIVVLHSLSSS